MRTEDIEKVASRRFTVLRPSDEPEPCILRWSRIKKQWLVTYTFKDKEDRDLKLAKLLERTENILD